MKDNYLIKMVDNPLTPPNIFTIEITNILLLSPSIKSHDFLMTWFYLNSSASLLPACKDDNSVLHLSNV